MTDYLVKMQKQFENIKLAQLYCLCKIIAESGLRNEDYIRSKYLDSALCFDETLTFLEQIKIIHNNTEGLIFDENFDFANSIEDFKIKLLEKLFYAKGAVSNQLADFLLNFKIESEGIIFNASPIDKIKYSDTRNILLELEYISVKSDNSCYAINSKFNDLFFKKIDHDGISLEAFKKNQCAKDELGLAAERAIIDFEIKRFTNISIKPDEIEHTSQKNVNAGYDIKSFENYLDDSLNRIERYIEVKAVSVLNFKFYWSRNEIAKSKIFGARYFLYLLPVKVNNTFDFDNLLIINNPFKNVYSNRKEWEKDEEIICMTKTMHE
jgi:hypothetical protein